MDGRGVSGLSTFQGYFLLSFSEACETARYFVLFFVTLVLCRLYGGMWSRLEGIQGFFCTS
jgi:hypothetical protein